MEKTFRTEDDARTVRRTLIDQGRQVSLIALDPARDMYVFDVYS